MTNMKLADGTEIFVDRWRYHTDREFELYGETIGWAAEDGTVVGSVEDRLQTRYLRRGVNGNIFECDPLSHEGFQAISLEGAITLGFTTSEYQAGLRRQILVKQYIQTERELAAEQLPPTDQWSMIVREGSDDWDEWDPLRRVPYPNESHFERYEVVGWSVGTVADRSQRPSDRFLAEFELRDNSTGRVFDSGHHLAEIGLESLSIKDALTLGFSTLEYHEALRTRLLERRHIIDEQDLVEARFPPAEVCRVLENEGRECTRRLDLVSRFHRPVPALDPMFRALDRKAELWDWLTRRVRPHPRKASRQDPFEKSVVNSAKLR
jgi:hypothetical protein